MPATTIIVQHNSGHPAQGKRVVLSFDYGGITDAVLTNRHGEATISHSTIGACKVIIDGTTRIRSFRAPGRTSYTL